MKSKELKALNSSFNLIDFYKKVGADKPDIAAPAEKKLKDNTTRASKIIHSHTHHKTNQIKFYSVNIHPKPDNSYKPAPKL
jgi:hypothetical protein